MPKKTNTNSQGNTKQRRRYTTTMFLRFLTTVRTDDIEGEGDEAMVGGKGQQEGVDKDDMLKVVD